MNVSTECDVGWMASKWVGGDDGESAGSVGLRSLSGFVHEKEAEVRLGDGNGG